MHSFNEEVSAINTKGYAIINTNDEIRNRSSSGGVFYVLAAEIIKQNGIVFGARFDDNWEVIHDYTDNLDGLIPFLGSKYVQSKIGNTYEKVRKFLHMNQKVLFTGTPCQIAGLKHFLVNEDDNLTTVDLICHGVPSRAVWRNYIKKIIKGRNVTNINFRDKSKGWLNFSLKIDFKNGDQLQNEDLFMKGYLKNIYLRPSCYECAFKGLERDADITLADFWGVQEILPQMFDDRGTSLVLIHTERGNDLLHSLCKKIQVCEVMLGQPIECNAAAIKSVSKPESRRQFYEGGVDNFKNLKKLTDEPLKKRIINKVKRIII